MDIKPEIIVSTSSNAIKAELRGTISDSLFVQYIQAIETAIPDFNGLPWAKIVDLQHWTAATSLAQQMISDALVKEAKLGLALEVIILPESHVGRWQLQKTIAPARSLIEILVVASEAEAFAIIELRGYSSVF